MATIATGRVGVIGSTFFDKDHHGPVQKSGNALSVADWIWTGRIWIGFDQRGKDIVGGLFCSIEEQLPIQQSGFLWENKRDGFFRGVQQDENISEVVGWLRLFRDGAGQPADQRGVLFAPVHARAAWVVPGDIGDSSVVIGLTGEEFGSAQGWVQVTQRDERLGESQEVRVEFVGFPIEPGDRIVLAISVIVSKLGTANFITHQEHRNALAQQESGQEVSELSGPFSLDGLAGRRAFDSVVQAVVVVLPITVVFTVGFIVFGLVAD